MALPALQLLLPHAHTCACGYRFGTTRSSNSAQCTHLRPLAADFYMSLYNVVFSALVPLIVGTMDVDVSKEMSRKYPGRLGLSQDTESSLQHLAQ